MILLLSNDCQKHIRYEIINVCATHYTDLFSRLESAARKIVCAGRIAAMLTYLLYLLTPWCRVLLEKLSWFAASQEIPRISRNPKVHYRTHKRPPPVSILGQPNPVNISTSHLLDDSQLQLRGTWLRYYWFCCVYFCLPNILNSMHVE